MQVITLTFKEVCSSVQFFPSRKKKNHPLIHHVIDTTPTLTKSIVSSLLLNFASCTITHLLTECIQVNLKETQKSRNEIDEQQAMLGGSS